MANPIHPYSIYNSTQAAELLGVDVVTIQRYIRNGKLSATKLGKVYRISGQSLLDLMSLDQDTIVSVQDRVKKTEAANYIKSKSFLLSNSKGQSYINLFSLTADALLAILEPRDEDSEDEKTLKYIGSRVFNTAMAAYGDTLSGYYQVSFSNQRDLIEIQFLLDYFKSDTNQIEKWRKSDNQARLKNFSPAKVRDYLDKRDGFKEKRREARYKQFCEYATHVSYTGFRLIANENNLIEIGPFYHESKLSNTIYELCLNFGYVVISLSANLKVENSLQAKLGIQLMEEFDKVFNFNVTKNQKFQEAKDNINALLQQLVENH